MAETAGMSVGDPMQGQQNEGQQNDPSNPTTGPSTGEQAQVSEQPPMSHEEILYQLKTEYNERRPSFYALRDAIKRQGSGPCSEQALQYFSYLKDEYDEIRYNLEMKTEALKEELTLEISKAKKTAVSWKNKYNAAVQAKDDIQFTLDNATGEHIPYVPKPKVFSVKVAELPTFQGEKNAEKVITFLTSLQRVFERRNRELGLVGTKEGWGEYGLGQLRGTAATWGQYEWPISKEVDWERFKTRIREHFVPHGTVEDLHCQMATLKITPGQSIRDFNDSFLQLRLRIRIISGLVSDDNVDDNVVNAYTTKLRTAAMNETGAKQRIKQVWAMFTSWRFQDSNKDAKLEDIMHYCQMMDGALNDKAAPNVVPTTSNSQASVFTPVPTPSEDGGDPMDLSSAELFKLAVQWVNRNGGGNKGKGSFEGGDINNDWKKRVKCWYCEKLGHLKSECRKKKADKEKSINQMEALSNDLEDSSLTEND